MISNIHPIPAFTDNYIWALSFGPDSSVCVVDPGDAKPVIDYLNSKQLTLTDILITHHHADHTGGIAALTELYSPRIWGPAGSHIPGITRYVAEGDQVEIGDTVFSVLEVPGHTLDHIAYFHRGTSLRTPLLFCGDTLFAAGCGRLFEGTPSQMYASLMKLKSLPKETEVYCTHEYTLANLAFAMAADPENEKLNQRLQIEKNKRSASRPTLPTSIAMELDTNPFMRCSDPNLIQHLTTQIHEKPASEVEVFTALRSWKDRF